MTPDDERHGTKNGYNAGCREGCCRHAHMVAVKRWRLYGGQSLIPAIGTQRRLQALCALGYTLHGLSAELGHTRSWGQAVMHYESVHPDTARKVDELYERICMIRPEGWIGDRARRTAARKGWAPPLAWDAIDDPNEQPKFGEKPRINGVIASEHAFLTRFGESDSAIAEALGIEPKSLEMALFRANKRAAA